MGTELLYEREEHLVEILNSRKYKFYSYPGREIDKVHEAYMDIEDRGTLYLRIYYHSNSTYDRDLIYEFNSEIGTIEYPHYCTGRIESLYEEINSEYSFLLQAQKKLTNETSLDSRLFIEMIDDPMFKVFIERIDSEISYFILEQLNTRIRVPYNVVRDKNLPEALMKVLEALLN